MITIDGKTYKATWLQDLQLNTEILNGENSGRLQGSAKMYLEYIGTFFNYTGELKRDGDCTDEEWHELFLTLSNPVNKHIGEFPFGTNQVLEQEVYIANLSMPLRKIDKERNIWDKVISVSFTAISPAWLPSGSIKGLR